MTKAELDQVFALAIEREVRAYEFYNDVAAKVKNETVRDIFSQLGREELGHKEKLEQIKAAPQIELKFKQPAADFKVAEATELPDPNTDMKPAEAIALAMKKEQQAVEYYRALAEAADDRELKQAFTNLANMELSHKQRLENAFVQIGYPEVF